MGSSLLETSAQRRHRWPSVLPGWTGFHRLAGDAGLVEIGNRWLGYLEARRFSAATVRGYAYDLVCLARFLDDAGISWRDLAPSDVFDWLEWQARPPTTSGQTGGGTRRWRHIDCNPANPIGPSAISATARLAIMK